jgi:alanine dehydrogenase
VVGAVLLPGARAPRLISREALGLMRRGSVVVDVAVDQGGCIETSRPTSIAEPTFVYKGVTHFCVPNFTADLGRSASVAVAQAMLPYVLTIAKHGVDGALEKCAELARGVCTLRGRRP